MAYNMSLFLVNKICFLLFDLFSQMNCWNIYFKIHVVRTRYFPNIYQYKCCFYDLIMCFFLFLILITRLILVIWLNTYTLEQIKAVKWTILSHTMHDYTKCFFFIRNIWCSHDTIDMILIKHLFYDLISAHIF